MTLTTYIWNILISFDQVLNAIFGGYPDETISLRAARARNQGETWGCLLCKFLDWIDEDHCDDSLRSKLASTIKRNAK